MSNENPAENQESVNRRRIEMALGVIERLLKPSFCADAWVEIGDALRTIEIEACINPTKACWMAWDLVLQVSRVVCPLYLASTRARTEKWSRLLPTEVLCDNRSKLDQAERLEYQARTSLDDPVIARKLYQEAVEICRAVYGRQAPFITSHFEKQAVDEVNEKKIKADRKARQALNRAKRAEENRRRAKDSGAGTKVTSGRIY